MWRHKCHSLTHFQLHVPTSLSIIVGAIYDSTGSFYSVYHLTAAVYIVASIAYALIIIFSKYQPSCIYPDTCATQDDVIDLSMDRVSIKRDSKQSVNKSDKKCEQLENGGGVWKMNDDRKLVFLEREGYGSNRTAEKHSEQSKFDRSDDNVDESDAMSDAKSNDTNLEPDGQSGCPMEDVIDRVEHCNLSTQKKWNLMTAFGIQK